MRSFKMFLAAMFVAAGAFGQEAQEEAIDWDAENITIYTAQQFYEFAFQVNHLKGENQGGKNFAGQTITLGANIDLNCDAANPWIPIGDQTGTGGVAYAGKHNTSFNGTFDGNYHTVKGMYVRNDGQNASGLFGVVMRQNDNQGRPLNGRTGTIKNLRVIESFSHGIRNVGLLVGQNHGIIENCSAQGEVRYGNGQSGQDNNQNIGLLAGVNYIATIRNCYASGFFSSAASTSRGNYIGGLVGMNISGSLIENCYADADITVGDMYVGGLTGIASNVKNSYATGNITTSTTSGTNVGGFTGSIANNSTIENCYATGNVMAGGSVGGFTGLGNSTTFKIENCYATGNVTGYYNYIGGFAGQISSSFGSIQLTNNYATGSVNAAQTSNYVGGLLGFQQNAVVTNSFYNSEISGLNDDDGRGAPKTTSQMKTQGTYTSWNFNDVWGINGDYPYLKTLDGIKTDFAWLEGEFNEKSKPPRPVYTLDWEAQEITINTAAQLIEFRDRANGVNDTRKDFAGQTIKLGADISLEGSENNQWIPIGILMSTTGDLNGTGAFAGTFDGAGHKISGLYIKPNFIHLDVLGFFEAISASATIKNLGLVDVYVDGYGRESIYDDDYSISRVGGLVGYSRGTIENCYVTGRVIGHSWVGGLVGYGYGTIKNCWTDVSVRAQNWYAGGLVGTASANIDSCYAKGDVWALCGYAGGLAGQNSSGGSIKNSYAKGNVKGGGGLIDNYILSNGQYVKAQTYVASWFMGGLVGINFNATIENSHATGDVYGMRNNIGGLVGMHQGSTDALGRPTAIKNSYATGNVSGPDVPVHANYPLQHFGGLVGNNYSGTIENSFATGKVTVGAVATNVGGLAGLNGEESIITNSFYNKSVYENQTPTRSAAKAVITDNGEGRTAEQLKRISTFTGWDFEEVWARVNDINDGFPHLRFGSTIANHEDAPIPNEPSDNTNIKAQKSGNGLGIIFAKNIVSVSADKELKIIETVISRDSDKKVSAQASKTVIYDNTGNVVFSGEGKNASAWDLRNKQGRIVANGTYLVIVEAKDKNGKVYWYSAKVGVNK
ncbi:MAG: hypothetical protein FWF51_03315 [Chitinivibrionia bacterium]|nr:hypothetical protein [Chitinivibrionia bacterium]